MKIMVCLKQVPHQDARLDVGPSGTWIQESNIKFEINSYDTYALEEALQIKDSGGAEGGHREQRGDGEQGDQGGSHGGLLRGIRRAPRRSASGATFISDLATGGAARGDPSAKSLNPRGFLPPQRLEMAGGLR